jgi:hypothetical protein
VKRIALAVVAIAGVAGDARADDALHPGVPVLDPPTITRRRRR